MSQIFASNVGSDNTKPLGAHPQIWCCYAGWFKTRQMDTSGSSALLVQSSDPQTSSHPILKETFRSVRV